MHIQPFICLVASAIVDLVTPSTVGLSHLNFFRHQRSKILHIDAPHSITYIEESRFPIKFLSNRLLADCSGPLSDLEEVRGETSPTELEGKEKERHSV